MLQGARCSYFNVFRNDSPAALSQGLPLRDVLMAIGSITSAEVHQRSVRFASPRKLLSCVPFNENEFGVLDRAEISRAVQRIVGLRINRELVGGQHG